MHPRRLRQIGPGAITVPFLLVTLQMAVHPDLPVREVARTTHATHTLGTAPETRLCLWIHDQLGTGAPSRNGVVA